VARLVSSRQLLSGDDVARGAGKTDTGLGGTTNRISLTYNRTYALMSSDATNYVRISQMTDVKKRLDSALSDRVDEASAVRIHIQSITAFASR
jgi:hypothetical protein